MYPQENTWGFGCPCIFCTGYRAHHVKTSPLDPAPAPAQLGLPVQNGEISLYPCLWVSEPLPLVEVLPKLIHFNKYLICSSGSQIYSVGK